MSRILLVEDDEGYRRQLEIGLCLLDQEIKAVSSGREALDVGVRFRPDLVVTDWMLKDDIHGMHVVQVLRAVLADLKAIMITGFASEGLRQEAGSADVLEFIEKPFSLDRIRRAVQDALAVRPEKESRPSLAAIEVTADGSIAYANSKAIEILKQARGGATATNLADLFEAGKQPDLDEAMDRWKAVSPLADRPLIWQLRTQEPQADGTRVVILRRSDEPQYLGLPLIEMLLGSISPKRAHWPFDGRALVVDAEAALRKWTVSMIEGVGGGCYAVDDLPHALPLLENDDGLGFVILDFETLGEDLASAIGRIHLARADVLIVGQSAQNRGAEFAQLGVDHFLQKPWRVEDLISLVVGRIGNCVGCGLPLPLLRPRSGDEPGDWVCCNCGASYCAVLDEEAPDDLLRNVRPRPLG